MNAGRMMRLWLGAALATGFAPIAGSAAAQPVERPAYVTATAMELPVETKQFGDLAEGPYNRLVIQNAMVIPGHGGPPVGPYDIVIEGNVITAMTPFDPVTAERRGETDRATGDRVIDATGMYVMPGMIDLHQHLRTEPLPLEYSYYLKLAHGVTTLVPAEEERLASVDHVRLSAANEILAPRLFPLWGWGGNLDYDRAFLENPENAPTIAREMAEQGAHVVSLGSVTWDEALFGAAAQAVWGVGGITSIHLPPSTVAVVDAVDAARLGVTMIEHHYGYAESALDRTVQDFPRDYNYNDELLRFRHAGKVWVEANEQPNRERLLNEVADSLVAYGVTMLPTRVVYEANRDIIRAANLPWHEKYTHQALIDWNLPNPAFHGSYHYDWSSEDEQYWSTAFDLWGDLIFEFNKRGGRVAYGTDDNYIWATAGFSNIRELQLLRQTGMHALEVLKAATHNSAQTLRQPRLGLVHPGYLADLIIVDGNPAYNLRFLYSFGALTLDDTGEMYRTRGIVHTIKDGIVINNDRLMEEVALMVAESKEGVTEPNVMTKPFLVNR